MIYRSNLTAPDLTPHFKHLTVRPMPHSFGHSVPSDWADKADDDPVFGLYKRCGLWTHDEAAILYNVAKQIGGTWLDIGSHSGWTTAQMLAAGCDVVAVDPIMWLKEGVERFEQNTYCWWSHVVGQSCEKSDSFFLYGVHGGEQYNGVCVDGCHEPGQPLRDALNAANRLTDTGVIIFHDFIGRPVREAVEWLMGQGFKARVYFTPHMIGLCWRGDFTPPDHVPDPNLPDLKARCPEFPFERCV